MQLFFISSIEYNHSDDRLPRLFSALCLQAFFFGKVKVLDDSIVQMIEFKHWHDFPMIISLLSRVHNLEYLHVS